MLSGINALIVRVRDRDELFNEACRIAVEEGGFSMSLICIVDRNAMKIVPVASADVRHATTIVVRRAPGSLSSRSLLDGFTGRMRRLREAYDTISADYPMISAVPDEVTMAMQTGDRIGYHPETTRVEIEALAGRCAAALSATEAHDDSKAPTSNAPASATAAEGDAERSKAHQARVQRALANLRDAR